MNTAVHAKARDSADGDKKEWLARIGYAAKGVVYGAVGVLTLGSLYNWFASAEVTGTRGALRAIASQPFGNVLVILMIVGLAGYVFWRFTQAIQDTEDKGSDATGWLQRIGFMISGFTYGGLAIYAARLAGWFGGSSSSNESSRTELTARVMSYDAGIWLVAATGAVLIGVGVYQAYRAISRKFAENWKTVEIDSDTQPFAVRFAQFGIMARAVTFWIIGGIVVRAALNANPENAQGLGHALQSLRDESYGPALLTLVGAGLVCYGIYCFVNARYRTMNT